MTPKMLDGVRDAGRHFLKETDAASAAALKATQPNSQRAIPGRADVERFLISSPDTHS